MADQQDAIEGKRSASTGKKKKQITNTDSLSGLSPISVRQQFDKSLKEGLKNLCVRPLSQCSVSADLPRLGKKHEVIDRTKNPSGVTVFPPPNLNQAGRSDFEFIRLLFKAIADQLGQSAIYNSTFDLHFSMFSNPSRNIKNTDLTKAVDDYLIELTESQPIVQLLKASCSQGIVSPAWVPLRLNLLKEFPFKDVKQGWQVFVVFEEKQIIIVHRKQEQSQDKGFTFCWELKMLFSRDMEFKDAHFAVTDLRFEEAMNSDERAKLEKVLEGWREETLLTIRPIQQTDDFQAIKSYQAEISNLKEEVLDLKVQIKEKNETIAFLAYQLHDLTRELDNLTPPRAEETDSTLFKKLFEPLNSIQEPLLIITRTGEVVFSTKQAAQVFQQKAIIGKTIAKLLPSYDLQDMIRPGRTIVVISPDVFYWTVEYFIPGCRQYLTCKLSKKEEIIYPVNQEILSQVDLSFVW